MEFNLLQSLKIAKMKSNEKLILINLKIFLTQLVCLEQKTL